MSYKIWREQFISQTAREGMPYFYAAGFLRVATTLNRLAELSCSSEAADRDRIKCPAARALKPGPCLCDLSTEGEHRTIPRIDLHAWQAEQRAERLAADLTRQTGQTWQIVTAGDPRGCVLGVIPPSYAERNAGRDRFDLDSIGVPSGPSGIRW